MNTVKNTTVCSYRNGCPHNFLFEFCNCCEDSFTLDLVTATRTVLLDWIKV